MFFARFVVWVGDLLPEKSKFTYHFCILFGYNECRQKVMVWRRKELEKLDSMFCLQREYLMLVAAREKALAEGIGPLDLRYPSLLASSVIDWEEEVRVHSDVLERYKKTGKERMERLDEALREYPQERVDAVTEACVNALKKEGSLGSGTTTP